MENEKEKEETPILEIGYEDIKIPECCREGWDNCPHTVKRERIKKGNVGL